jgi:hypothetical protein
MSRILKETIRCPHCGAVHDIELDLQQVSIKPTDVFACRECKKNFTLMDAYDKMHKPDPKEYEAHSEELEKLKKRLLELEDYSSDKFYILGCKAINGNWYYANSDSAHYREEFILDGVKQPKYYEEKSRLEKEIEKLGFTQQLRLYGYKRADFKDVVFAEELKKKTDALKMLKHFEVEIEKMNEAIKERNRLRDFIQKVNNAISEELMTRQEIEAKKTIIDRIKELNGVIDEISEMTNEAQHRRAVQDYDQI